MLKTNWPTRAKCRETVNAGSRRGLKRPSKRKQAAMLAARGAREADPNGDRFQIATAVFKRAKRDDIVAQREAEIRAMPVAYPLKVAPAPPVERAPYECSDGDMRDVRYKPGDVRAVRTIRAIVSPRPIPVGWRDLPVRKPNV